MLQNIPPIRLAALDLDGTLLNHTGRISPRTQQAIANAVAHGVVVVAATGRPLGNLPPVVAQLPGRVMPSPPTAPPSGIWAQTRWPPSTADTPTQPSERPPSPPASFAAFSRPRKPGRSLPSTPSFPDP